MTEKIQRSYTNKERREALAAFAFTGGNEKRTVALLKEAGLDVAFETLRSWTYRHQDEYRQIRNEIEGYSREARADHHARIANMAMTSEEMGLENLQKDVETGEVTLTASDIKNLAVTAGIHTEKTELLNDRPTTRVANDLSDLKPALEALGIELIEGEATDVTEQPVIEAEIVSEG